MEDKYKNDPNKLDRVVEEIVIILKSAEITRKDFDYIKEKLNFETSCQFRLK